MNLFMLRIIPIQVIKSKEWKRKFYMNYDLNLIDLQGKTLEPMYLKKLNLLNLVFSFFVVIRLYQVRVMNNMLLENSLLIWHYLIYYVLVWLRHF
jgi:hypothetical protein